MKLLPQMPLCESSVKGKSSLLEIYFHQAQMSQESQRNKKKPMSIEDSVLASIYISLESLASPKSIKTSESLESQKS